MCRYDRVHHKATPRCSPAAAASFLMSLPPDVARLQDHTVIAGFMAMDPEFRSALLVSEGFYSSCACEEGGDVQRDALETVRDVIM